MAPLPETAVFSRQSEVFGSWQFQDLGCLAVELADSNLAVAATVDYAVNCPLQNTL